MDPIHDFIIGVVNRWTKWLNRDDVMDSDTWTYHLNGEEKAMPNHATSEYFKENPFSYPERAIVRLDSQVTMYRDKIVKLEKELEEANKTLCYTSSLLENVNNMSLISIIKERFIKWLFGSKGKSNEKV